MKDQIVLGAPVRDVISGFAGIVTGDCTYLTGCRQMLVAPTVDANGAARDAHWFDFQRLERVVGDVVKLDNGPTPGFDKPAPKR